jgi:6-phosphogluconolactonase
MLLGMGLDGHFASLFPSMVGDAAMNVDTAPAIIQTGPDGDPLCPRISMNLPMILQSRLVFLLVKGAAKQEILRAAQTDQLLPVHHLITQTVKSVQIVTQ